MAETTNVALQALKNRGAIEVDKKTHVEDTFKERITTSGVYRDVTISEVVEIPSKGGALELIVRFAGNEIQGEGSTWTVNKEGKSIQHGSSLFDSLLICAGKSKTKGKLSKVKHFGKEVDGLVYSAFVGMKACIAIRAEFGIYNEKLSTRWSLRRVFNKDGLSSTELVAGVTEPEAIDKEAKFLKDKYEDGLDADSVAILRNGGTAPDADDGDDTDDGSDGFADEDETPTTPTSDEMGDDEQLGETPVIPEEEPEAKPEEEPEPKKEVVTPEVVPDAKPTGGSEDEATEGEDW